MLGELSQSASAASTENGTAAAEKEEPAKESALPDDLDLDSLPEADRKQLEELAQQQDMATAQALAFKVRGERLMTLACPVAVVCCRCSLGCRLANPRSLPLGRLS